MKLYECSNGVLINPDNVTHCYKSRSEGGYSVWFYFNGGTNSNIYYAQESQAINELLGYQQHCDK